MYPVQVYEHEGVNVPEPVRARRCELNFSSLVANAPVLTDGAWGTELQARGLPAGKCADVWNVSNPDAVAEVARSYVEAGSEVILTNTFRSNAMSLARIGMSEQTVTLNHKGADLSRRAADGRALVFGSIGPIGELVSASEQLRTKAALAFAQQAQVLAGGGVDALLIETMTDLEEAKIAIAAALRTDLPVVVSFAFGAGRKASGPTPEEAAAAMTSAGASAVGANCCNHGETAVGLCRQVRAATRLPIWLKPSAGMPVPCGEGLAYDLTPAKFASQIPLFVEAGAAFIGGCCGCGPAFIAAAARCLGKPLPARANSPS